MGQIYIRTFTGRQFYLDDPTPEMICIEDIAHSLSNLCRFTGHTKQFYPVAQHCIWVAKTLEAWGEPLSTLFAGIHHEDGEAYYGDLSSPLKILLGDAYKTLRGPIDRAAEKAFGLDDLPPWVWERVKLADNCVLLAEGREIVTGFGVTLQEMFDRGVDERLLKLVPPIRECWAPKFAEHQFLNWHRGLENQRRVRDDG